MESNKTIYLLGYASDIAAAHTGSADGPLVMHQSPYFKTLHKMGLNMHWQRIIKALPQANIAQLSMVGQQCNELAVEVSRLAKEKHFFVVLGGDHSSAIGTWSGAFDAIKDQGELGLIWIDAHMDSHTHETTPSGNIHGMPLASLLGHGESSLTSILNKNPKIKPENVCLIGIRSYEPGEEALLKQLNVRIFYMEEVLQRGLADVMQEAIQLATKETAGYGVTIDIDSMEPSDAPGTGVTEPGGIRADDLCQVLQKLADDPHLIGIEIAEFDPHRDRDHITEKLVARMLAAVTLGKAFL